MARVLPHSFYRRPTLDVARDVLGCLLVRDSEEGRVAGMVVEAEAYRGEDDPACHAAVGRTPRNRVMYGPPGHAYVYFTYGMHYCLNLVTEEEGFPAAVLLRAAEPLVGLDLMRARRGCREPGLLASGPARLTQAFGVDLSLNGHDLAGAPLWLERRGAPIRGAAIARGPRVGVGVGGERPWRFFLAGHPCVSPGRRGSAPVARRGSAALPRTAGRRPGGVPRPGRGVSRLTPFESGT